MSTLGEDLKAARDGLRKAREEASSAISEQAVVTQLVIEEITKLKKETEDMRSEITGLNGGPA